ncbi:MAG: hypothetical protein ACSLEN_03855 [Candidatus Malihini olakiniferum]
MQNDSELELLLAGRANTAVMYESQADQGVEQELKVIYGFHPRLS